jgi:hypothetical protein
MEFVGKIFVKCHLADVRLLTDLFDGDAFYAMTGKQFFCGFNDLDLLLGFISGQIITHEIIFHTKIINNYFIRIFFI